MRAKAACAAASADDFSLAYNTMRKGNPICGCVYSKRESDGLVVAHPARSKGMSSRQNRRTLQRYQMARAGRIDLRFTPPNLIATFQPRGRTTLELIYSGCGWTRTGGHQHRFIH